MPGARTVFKRRCFTITRRERGCPLELGALVAWAIPFDDRGNGTGTPPARDSTGVAPYRVSVVVLVMVMLGSLWSFLPTWPIFFSPKVWCLFLVFHNTTLLWLNREGTKPCHHHLSATGLLMRHEPRRFQSATGSTGRLYRTRSYQYVSEG